MKFRDWLDGVRRVGLAALPEARVLGCPTAFDGLVIGRLGHCMAECSRPGSLPGRAEARRGSGERSELEPDTGAQMILPPKLYSEPYDE